MLPGGFRAADRGVFGADIVGVMVRRRVVITGLGVVTPFGVGIDALWDGLCAGECAIGPIEAFDASGAVCGVAGEVKGVKVRDHVPKSYRKAVKVMARDTELAVVAAMDAVRSAGLVTKANAEDGEEPTYAARRVGCQIGAGLIAAEVDELARAIAVSAPEGAFSLKAWGETGMDSLTPLWMLKYLPNMLACHVTIVHDARGPSNTITCAEASGALSIGESVRVIERGDADAAFAGGAESKVNATWLTRLRDVLAPDGVAKPYDDSSAGTVAAEGGGLLMLESRETALERGASVFAEVTGFGAAHSPRTPDHEKRSLGLRYAIEAALNDAGAEPGGVDAIVVQASGWRDQDESESVALNAVFGPDAGGKELVTLTPAIGNAYAGQGGIATAVAAKAIAASKLPARVHPGSPRGGFGAAAAARDAELGRVLVATQSMGGQCAALVVERAS